jgi:DNA primase
MGQQVPSTHAHPRYHRQMRFDERFLDEIKSRLRLSEVIGRTVKLRRQGREFVGLSPFTKERTPSFFVNDDKGFFHDFSSGKHGDLISFLQETERLSFVEAVERLAAEAGVALPAPDPRAAEQERERQTLSDWLEQAAKWFESELRRPVGAEARAYLSRRGLPEAEWARFRLGFAPSSRTALKDYLVERGAKPGELVEAGLLIAPEDGGAPFDRFRERIIFPIADVRGRVVSFGGRAMDPEARAKYLNGPETSLFHKGRTLYGLGETRRLLSAGAADKASVAVVEGFMDAIACHRADIPAVASLGTALTEEQMEVLWRLSPEPVLCFDGDAAGQRAASRAIDRALPLLKAGRSFSFAMLSGGKDPDEVLREQGAAALRQQLGKSVPLVEALFARERDLEPLDTPERRAAFKLRLRTAATTIADKELAQAYRDELVQRFDALFARAPATAPQRAAQRRGYRRAAFEDAPLTADGRAGGRALRRAPEPLPAAVAQAAIADPIRLDPHLETLETHGFGDPALDHLAKEIIRLRLDADHLDTGALARHLADDGFGALLGEIDKAALKSGAPFLKSDVSPTLARSQWSHAFEALARMAALGDAIEAEKGNLSGRGGMEAIERMKTERDALRRAIGSGTIWDAGES